MDATECLSINAAYDMKSVRVHDANCVIATGRVYLSDMKVKGDKRRCFCFCYGLLF